MSKSLGNGIDPLDVIDKYGADALRLTLMTGNAPGERYAFLLGKSRGPAGISPIRVWNASRFILMNLDAAEVPEKTEESSLALEDRWILQKVNLLASEVTENMEKFELGIAVQKVYDFIWEEFCDWYIEMVKPRLYSETADTKAAALWTLKTVLTNALKMLHPFMPFITEEIFCTLNPDEESIMISSWPEYNSKWEYTAAAAEVELMKEAVRGIRNVRTQLNVPPSKKASVYVVSESADIRRTFEDGKVFFATLAKAGEVLIQENRDGIGEDAVSAMIPGANIYIPFAELVDIEKELERLEKEKERLTKEIARSKRNAEQ